MQVKGGLRPEYKSYECQKCFVGHSRETEWCDDILSACAEVLPRFGLEPWYAADHFDPTKPLRDKVVELVANARYGIYDLSSWRDKSGEWHLPRNVFMTAKAEHIQDESGAMLWTPTMPGKKLGQSLPYFFDEVFAMRVKEVDGETKRALQTATDGVWTAKDRSGALAQFEEPNLEAIYNKIIG